MRPLKLLVELCLFFFLTHNWGWEKAFAWSSDDDERLGWYPPQTKPD